MNKTFYKRKAKTKVFFNKDMKVRSYAYGAGVTSAFLEWQKYYYSTRGPIGDKLIISSQGSIDGKTKADSSRGGGSSGDGLSSLYFDSRRFEISKDGWVSVNGNRTSLNAGVELKAWAILTVSEKGIKKNALCIISHPNGASGMALSFYPISKRGPEETPFLTRELEYTPDPNSFLLCMGRHIFIVHNSKLDYLYYNIEKEELESVAIGADSDNTEHDWCQYVSHKMVAGTTGYVFWMSGVDVYGFRIGYPGKLIHIEGGRFEEPVDLACSGAALTVFRKSKNTSKISESRYTEGYDGTFVEKRIEDKASGGFSFGRR